MAKISANGETEAAKVKARSQAGHEYLYVITSGGRLLRRATGDAGTGYNLLYRGIKPERRNMATLRDIVARVYSMTVVG